MGDVGLDNVDEAPVQNIAEAVSEEQAFAGRDICPVIRVAHLLHCIEIIGRDRLFEEQQVELFYSVDLAIGQRRSSAPVVVDHDVDIRTEFLTHALDLLVQVADHVGLVEPVSPHDPSAGLERREPLVDGFFAAPEVGSVGVGADPVADSTAEHLVNRQVVDLPGEVPQCDVDCRHRAAHYDTTAPEAVAVHDLPVFLDLSRVPADQPVCESINSSGNSLFVPFERAFAPAVHALVGFDLAEDPVAPSAVHQESFNVGDLHVFPDSIRVVSYCCHSELHRFC